MKNLTLLCFLLFSLSLFSQEYTIEKSEIPVHYKTPLPLNEMELILPKISTQTIQKKGSYLKTIHDRLSNGNEDPNTPDPIIQSNYNKDDKEYKALVSGWNGLAQNGVVPADPVIAVGPNHVVQMVNSAGSIGTFGSTIAIYNKAGTSLITPFSYETISGSDGAGDPIVLYDQFADRWIISEFNESGSTNSINLSVSSSGNPVTSTWTTWIVPTTEFPDYPKWGLWRDSYIVSSNEGGNIGNYAFERADILAGTSLTSFKLTFSNANGGFQAGAPVSIHGNSWSPVGEPGIILNIEDNEWSGISTDAIAVWEFNVNWSAPSASITKVQTIPVASFSSIFCGNPWPPACIPQPSPGPNLWAISHVIMNQATYRNFGAYEAIACTHMVDVGSDRAGIRWYELRRSPGGNWFIEQQSTYTPGSSLHRFHPSICMNGKGEIGLSYNVSSSTVNPGIRFTGRNYCDNYNQMTFPETVIMAGTSSTNNTRLGDYGVLVPDPADDNVFWTNAMYHSTSAWRTRIASFTIESTTGGTVYVDNTAAANGNGSVSNPFNSVVEAYQKFCDGYNVMMLEGGTYIEASLPQLMDSHNFTIESRNGTGLIIKN